MDNSIPHSDLSYDLQTHMSNYLQILHLNISLLLYLK